MAYAFSFQYCRDAGPHQRILITYFIPANYFSVKCVRFFISTQPEFPKDLPMPSKDCRRLPKFAKDFQRLLKIAEDCRRFLTTSEDCQRFPNDFRR